MGWRPSSARSSLLPSPPASLSPHPPHCHLSPLTASSGFQTVPLGEAGTGQGRLLGTEVQVRMAWTSPPGLWGGDGHSALQLTAPPGPSFHQPQGSPGGPEHLLTPVPPGGRFPPLWAEGTPHPALTTSPGPCLHRVFSSLSTLRLVI